MPHSNVYILHHASLPLHLYQIQSKLLCDSVRTFACCNSHAITTNASGFIDWRGMLRSCKRRGKLQQHTFAEKLEGSNSSGLMDLMKHHKQIRDKISPPALPENWGPFFKHADKLISFPTRQTPGLMSVFCFKLTYLHYLFCLLLTVFPVIVKQV